MTPFRTLIGLQELHVATREDSGVLCSERRGILWRWRGPSGLRWVWRNAQSPGREAALAWASLAQRFPASSVLAREGAGCRSVGDAIHGVAQSRTRLTRRLAGLSSALAFPLDLGARPLCRRLRGRGCANCQSLPRAPPRHAHGDLTSLAPHVQTCLTDPMLCA